MMRLLILVEGQTEEAFANRTIVPYLAQHEIFASVQLAENRSKATQRRFKGGVSTYRQIEAHLLRWWKQSGGNDCWATTMFDLYALPEDFPGYAAAMSQSDPYDRVGRLEQAFSEAVAARDLRRLVPYFQLHEFEALILADPQKLDFEFIESDAAIAKLKSDIEGFSSPELINQTPTGAPSKRIIARIPEYQFRKASAGPVVAGRIGLPVLRERCPHFNHWLSSLVALR